MILGLFGLLCLFFFMVVLFGLFVCFCFCVHKEGCVVLGFFFFTVLFVVTVK